MWALETRISTVLMGGKAPQEAGTEGTGQGRFRYANDVHELCGISHILSHMGGGRDGDMGGCGS